MISTRETIFSAVFNQLAQAPGLVTTSRRLTPLESVDASQCPALFTVQGKEDSMFAEQGGPRKFGLPYSFHLILFALIYQASNTDPSFVPISAVNPILDYIEAQFPRQITPGPNSTVIRAGQNTLGIPGVQQVQIEDIMSDEGLLGSNSLAVVQLGIYAL